MLFALGLALLAVLVGVLISDLAWPVKLGAWVLLTILLDECGGWFGYLGWVAGGVPFALPLLAGTPLEAFDTGNTPPEWGVILPLVGAGLLALLLVKHAGGLTALPLSLLAFAVPIVLARVVGHRLDASVTLPESRAFLAWTVWPAVLGIALALARRILLPPRSAA